MKCKGFVLSKTNMFSFGPLIPIKRRAGPDQYFRGKGQMSKWIDGNK
jgi:hypothetical protein